MTGTSATRVLEELDPAVIDELTAKCVAAPDVYARAMATAAKAGVDVWEVRRVRTSDTPFPALSVIDGGDAMFVDADLTEPRRAALVYVGLMATGRYAVKDDA